MVDCETERPKTFEMMLKVGSHTVKADADRPTRGEETAPGVHRYFDAARAICKAHTATWYAKKNGIPLERVATHVERDASQERQGIYRLKVKLEFFGPLDD